MYQLFSRLCKRGEPIGSAELEPKFPPGPYTETVPAADTTALLLRFGAFELDLQTNELRRGGVLLKLSPQQLQVLRLLADNAGQLLTREQIQAEVWRDGTFVDFDRNLNVCIAQIRATLNDDSDAPRYIQTLPKRGYRFIAPVERVNAFPPSVAVQPAAPKQSRWVLAALLVLIVVGATGYLVWQRTRPTVRVLLAALPFENLTGDPNEDMFTDGLTEELISHFGSLNPARLGVIGRSSVMRYKTAPHGIDQIGRDLRVDYVIEGTVRRSAGRIRIAARLIKVADQAQVWAGTSERAESEMFQMEEEAAARIAGAVTEKLLGGIITVPVTSHTANPAAHDAYLTGRYLQHKSSRADYERSISYFEEAARLDPRFDLAYSAQAETYVSLGRSGTPPAEVFPQARAAAEKALAIRENNAEAHNALANAYFWHEWNWPLAEQHFKRSIAINPSFSMAHHDYAFFLIAMGRTEQGLASLQRAIAMDPLSARVNIDAGWLLLQAHHFDDAVRQARRTLQLEPDLGEAKACIARSLFHQKQYRELAEMLHAPGPNPEEALKTLYRERVRQGTANPFTQATYLVFLGETSKALDALDQAYLHRSTMMPLLKAEPSLTPLHNDPRFQALARKLSLQ